MDADLLGRLYATPDSDARWIPVLDGLCERLQVVSAVVQVLREAPNGIDIIWGARDSRSAANSATHDRWVNNADNPRLPRIAAQVPPSAAQLLHVGCDSRLFADKPGQLAHLRERTSRVGLGEAFWASFAAGPSRRFSLILHRDAGDFRDLTEVEETTLWQLLPHLEQSVRLASTISEARSHAAALEVAADQLEIAMVLCTPDLRVIWRNSAAAVLLAKSHILRLSGDRLQARLPADKATLTQLACHAASCGGRSMVGTLAALSETPIHVRASRACENDGGVRIALYLSVPANRTRLDPQEISRLFGLTPAEARLAGALGTGASLAEYAKEAGIAVGTARNQLKQVQSKTYTSRQAELVRLLGESILSRTKGSCERD